MQTMNRKYGVAVILAGVLLFASHRAAAQFPGDAEQYMLEVGSPAFNTPDGVPNGFVNMANGNLHIEIPIVSYPQRGGIPFVTKMVYDSRIWKIATTPYAAVWSASNVDNSLYAGWRVQSTGPVNEGNSEPVMDQAVKSCYQNGNPYYWVEFLNYRYSDPSGTKRKFPIYTESAAPPCHTPTNLTTSGPALDGSGMWLNLVTSSHVVKEVLTADGSRVYGSIYYGGLGWAKDTNGNYFEQQVNGEGDYGGFIDTLNRQLPISLTGSGNEVWYTVPTTAAGGTAVYKWLEGRRQALAQISTWRVSTMYRTSRSPC